MAETTIEWTATHLPDGTVLPGYTMNPWWGCQRVSEGCRNCYAEILSKRWGYNNWGPATTTERRRTARDNWVKPRAWDREAQRSGIRRKVFCASMSDVFEDHPQVAPWREELWPLIAETPHLDWLLLTKRPEHILELVPGQWWETWPAHVWIGTSVENQAEADRRIPHLLAVPARIRFLSCEPLLGPVDLARWLTPCPACGVPISGNLSCTYCEAYPEARPVEWVIVGGESGPKARPMRSEWARSLRDQCVAAKVPYFFKQHGEYLATDQLSDVANGLIALDERVQHHLDGAGGIWWRFGKKRSGRLLDGRTWDEAPA
jgi:protein gp37